METLGNFPFGEEVTILSQRDRSRKKYFVIGSYASAVHTSWYNAAGKVVTKTLPIANEPEFLWTGNSFEAMTLINRVNIPPEAGRLSDPGKWMNGGVGRIFNIDFLKPLNLFRSDLWITLLIPFTLANKGQRKAISRYERQRTEFNLPASRIVPSNVKSSIIDDTRISEILSELEESEAEIIITLGDLPLHHFIKAFDPEKLNLSSFNLYGRLHNITINEKLYRLLPLYHPKAGENVGAYTQRWRNAHRDWISYIAHTLDL